MKTKYFFFVLVLLLSINFISSVENVREEEFGYNILEPGRNLQPDTNFSKKNVNSSEIWVTNIGDLDNVNATEFENNGGILTSIRSFWDGLYCKLTGCTMQGDINLNGNDILNARDINASRNVSVGGSLNVSDDVFFGGRLFVDVNPSAQSALVNPGDSIFGGNVFTRDGGFFAFAPNASLGLLIGNKGDDTTGKTRFFFTSSGILNVSTRLFCDSTNNPFFENNTGDVFFHVSSNELGVRQLIFTIIVVHNSTCASLNFGALGSEIIPDLTGVNYAIGPSGIFQVLDKGVINMYVGEHPDAAFTINTFNGTGERGVLINDVAGADSHSSLETNTDVNGFVGIISNLISIFSSKNISDSTKGIQIDLDPINFIGGSFDYYDANLLSVNNLTETTALLVNSDINNIIKVGKSEMNEIVFYDNTTDTLNITLIVEDLDQSVNFFEANDAALYIGNTENITKINIILENNSLTEINFKVFYCNNAEDYIELNFSDTTNGFIKSGSINIQNPSDRGICNQDIDGNAFSNTTNFAYLAIQRNETTVPQNPVLNNLAKVKDNARFVYGNNGLSDVNNAFGFVNDELLGEGEIVYYVEAKSNTGDIRTPMWLQVGKNNSVSGIGNSLFVLPNFWGEDNFSNGDGTVNMSQLSNYQTLCDTFGPSFFSEGDVCRFAADTRGRGMPLLATGDLEVWLSTVLHNGINSRGPATFIMEDNHFEIVNGPLHPFQERIQLVGFDAGDNVTALSATFNAGLLSPFAQITTGGGVSEWVVVSDANCHSSQCARSQAGTGSPLRIMEANFSTSLLDRINLTFWVTTLNIEGGDLLNVTINNNTGSGEIQLFATSTNLADQQQNVAFPVEMENSSVDISLRFKFNANNPINEEVFIDEVIVIGNATASTLANVTVIDSEILFGSDVGDGILYTGPEASGTSSINITADEINLLGNVTQVSVTQVDLNITENLTVGDTLFTDNIDSVSGGGISFFDNLDGQGIYNLTNFDWGFFNFLSGSGENLHSVNISTLGGSNLTNDFNWINESDGIRLGFNETFNSTYDNAMLNNTIGGYVVQAETVNMSGNITMPKGRIRSGSYGVEIVGNQGVLPFAVIGQGVIVGTEVKLMSVEGGRGGWLFQSHRLGGFTPAFIFNNSGGNDIINAYRASSGLKVWEVDATGNHLINLDNLYSAWGNTSTDLRISSDGDNGVYNTTGEHRFIGNLNNSGHNISADNIILPISTSSLGQIQQDGARIFNTITPSNQAPSFLNIFIGKNSGSLLLNNTAQPFHGTGNVGIGEGTLDAVTSGFYNFALGTNAGTAITFGTSNVLIGHQAGLNLAGGSSNVLIGRDAGVFSTGGNNMGIGQNALRENDNGDKNVAIGSDAGRGQAGGTRDYDNNVFIGESSGMNITDGDGNICIGFESCKTQITTESNKLYIDNSDTATPLIYGEFDNDYLAINGDLNVTNNITADNGFYEKLNATNISTETLEVDHIAEKETNHNIVFDNHLQIIVDEPSGPLTFSELEFNLAKIREEQLGGSTFLKITAPTSITLEVGTDIGLGIASNSVKPLETKVTDLGSSSFNWKDLYLDGKVDFGTNTITDGSMTGDWDFGSGDLTADLFKGNFNWTTPSEYLSFTGSSLDFNDSLLNLTISNAGIRLGFNETRNITYENWNQSFADTLYAPNTTTGIEVLINSTIEDISSEVGSSMMLWGYNYDTQDGSWARITLDANYIGNGYTSNIVGGCDDGDHLNWTAYMGAGTYTLKAMQLHFSAGGIFDIRIDNAQVASFDTYNASTLRNEVDIQDSIVVSTSGVKTISYIADGKNPSSSNECNNFRYLNFRRTS